ncbi:hypothetical protein ATANTOWER_015988 [Ataeniobius toweri]|uniref:Uncharacterized protein n=1 Tax=Ataeniobius toweri TaxID=208326 RepID=A0ABU7A183_9TELE|nr:hypothetical protein [Ataeniobius toweri]
MTRGRGELWREGSYIDVSQCIIVHRANRLPVNGSGWGPVLTDFSILVWLTKKGVTESFDEIHSNMSCCVMPHIFPIYLSAKLELSFGLQERTIEDYVFCPKLRRINSGDQCAFTFVSNAKSVIVFGRSSCMLQL